MFGIPKEFLTIFIRRQKNEDEEKGNG